MASLKNRLKGQIKKLVAPKDLMQEQAPATAHGPRQATFDPVASGMTPVRLGTILKQAVDDDPHDFLGFAEEMEERDPHYRSVLGTRKRALSGIEPIVTAASDDAKDIEIADAVREHLVETPHFNGLVEDALDGLGKGFAVVEIMWQTDVVPWRPSEFVWRDPRHFQFDKITRREIRLREDGHDEGLELKPHHYVVHIPHLKSGLPIRGGLARLAAWSFLIKSYTVKDWAAFAEGYGMPIRVGKYGPSATDKDKRLLLKALRQIAADMAVAIPESMEIDLVERKGGGGDPVFAGLADFADKQVSKGVLGQTMTTDDGASMAQANVHENVRFDVLKADARQMEATLNGGLVIPFVDFNYGVQEVYPLISFPVIEPEDLKALSAITKNLVEMGVHLGETDVRERFGFKEPGKDDEILVPPAKSAPAPTSKADDDKTTASARQPCPSCGVVHSSLSLSAVPASTPLVDELDAIGADALADWAALIGPITGPALDAIAAATSLEEIQSILEGTAPDGIDIGPMARALAKLTATARGLGDLPDA